MGEFFHMGGYAGFIWPAYGAVALVLLGVLAASLRFQKSTEGELAGLDTGRRRRDGAAGGSNDET